MTQRRRGGRNQLNRPSGGQPQGAVIAPPVSRRRRPPTTQPIPKPIAIAAGLLIVVIATVLAVNWWFSVKRPQDKPILVVNSRTFRWSDFMTILQFEKLAAAQVGAPFHAGQEPYNLMQLMTENELISQAAAREGLHATRAELRTEMTKRQVPNADKITDAGQRDRELDLRLGGYLDAVRLTHGQYEDIIRADLYRQQLRDKLGANIPRVQPQAYIQIIQVPNDQIDAVQRDLGAGTPFETVARRSSKEPNVEANGGEIGWVPRLAYPDLDGDLFGLKEGTLSRPIADKDGIWLVRVVEHMEGAAHLQGMRFMTDTAADAAERRLRDGASFTDLTAELSTDPATKAARGEMGIVKVGQRGPEFDEVIRGAPENRLIGPVLSGPDALFALINKRTAAQEVSQDHFEVLKQRALDDWLNKERVRSHIDYCPGGEDNCFGSVKVDKALRELETISLTRSQEAAATAAVAPPPGSQSGFP